MHKKRLFYSLSRDDINKCQGAALLQQVHILGGEESRSKPWRGDTVCIASKLQASFYRKMGTLRAMDGKTSLSRRTASFPWRRIHAANLGSAA